MTPIALTFLILAILLVWGGLVVSTIALMKSSTGADVDSAELPAAGTS